MEANNRRRKRREFRARDTSDLRAGLVLKRQVGETIHIGEDCIVTLLSTQGPFAQIHIHAPGIAIDRGEIRRQKMRNGQA